MTEIVRLAREKILESMKQFGVPVSPLLADQISEYIDLLLFWNEKINLTSVTDPPKILEVHFAESFFGAISQGIESGDLVDVGSGAGFPALPIVMLRPGIRATLLEPNAKKAAFLWEVSRKVGIVDRITVVRSRLEDFPAAPNADFITSRAVRAGDPSFLGHCSQLLKPGGRLVLWLTVQDASALKTQPGWRWEAPVLIPFRAEACVVSGMPIES
jgi:16S rRNA (guanine527-N7)-methyltransferase